MTEKTLEKLKKDYPRKKYEKDHYLGSEYIKMEDLLDGLSLLKERWGEKEGFQEIGVFTDYDTYNITAIGTFLETDEEWEKRIVDQYNLTQEYKKSMEQKILEEERKQYERLKKKFEGTS